MYVIKGFKKFKGHEGEPLAQGTLYRDNVKVADWSDDSHGGPLRLDFMNKTAETDFLAFAKEYLSDKVDCDDKPYDMAHDSWYLVECALQELSYAHEARLGLARLAKKGICYKAKEKGKVETFSVNLAYTASNVAQLKAKYGADLVEIVNEVLGLPLIDEETAKIAAQNAHYKKLCAKVLLFSVKEPDGAVIVKQSKLAYSPALVATMRAKYPNLVEIINERYL